MAIRWKKVAKVCALGVGIPVVIGVCFMGYTVHEVAAHTGLSYQDTVKRFWRGESERAHNLNWVDDATEQIAHPPLQLGASYGYFQRATAYLYLNELDKTDADYETGKKANPDSYGKGSMVSTLGSVLIERHEYERGTKIFEELLAVPEFRTHINTFRYASFLARTKNEKYRDTARAVELARSVLAISGYKANRYDHELLGQCLASNSEFEEAIKEAEIALSLPAANEHCAASDEKNLNALIERCKRREISYSTYY